MRFDSTLIAALLGALLALTGCADPSTTGTSPVVDDDINSPADDDDTSSPEDRTWNLPLEISGCGDAVEEADVWGHESLDIYQNVDSDDDVMAGSWSVDVPIEGRWRELHVYGVEFAHRSLSVCAMQNGGNVEVYTAYDVSGSCTDIGAREDVGAQQVDGTLEIALNYNMGALCEQSEDAGSSQCSPSLGGNAWYLELFLGDPGVYDLTMGPLTENGQLVYGFDNWTPVINGCTLTFSTGNESLDVMVDPLGGPNSSGSFNSGEGSFFGYRE